MIKAVIKASRSASGPAHNAPSTPNTIGSMIVAGSRYTICLDRERIDACTGLPIDWKKTPVAICSALIGHARRKIRKHFTANSLYSSDSDPNSRTMLIGANWNTKNASTNTMVDTVRIIRYACFTLSFCPLP